MQAFENKVCVVTGAASGFGREFARKAASLGMRLVLADIEPGSLESCAEELRQAGAEVMAQQTDVSRADEVQSLADQSFARFGAVHLLFNNAGVAAGGFLWEHTPADWQWVLGVNLMGVVHGVHSFVPRMIAQGDDSHVVNTASVAGLISPQLMGVYNVSKHAVVALSETLHHDLRVARASLGVSVLCPAFVPTGINRSERNRPEALRASTPATESMTAAQRSLDQAVGSGRLDARAIAELSFSAVRERRFYCLSHPKILGAVELRMQDILQGRNPSDPFGARPELAPKQRD
jgi:NAD(P)-dependent dehydrogenase (short-subunit alcohol dehydrogenase family)